MIFSMLWKRLHLHIALILSLNLPSAAFSQGNCVQFDIIGGNAAKGDCIWVPVVVYNFDTILSVQFGLTYDPQTVVPVGKWTYPNLVGLDTTAINFDAVRKIVRFLWANPNADCSGLKDGDTLIMIKFKLIGEPGSCTGIDFFNRSPIQNEVLDCNADEYCFERINTQDDEICIGLPVNLCVLAYSCGTLTNSGNITIKPYGGTPPYYINRLVPPQSDTLYQSGDCLVYNNLFPGDYVITVRDASGKDTILNVKVGTGTPIAIFSNGIIQPRCWNSADGEINIRITGGIGPLTIGWRPTGDYGLTTLRRLPVGDYTVTVRDSSGCLATETFKLFADTIFSEVDVLKDASCTDDGSAVARARGGNPYPGNLYDFFWSQNVAANSTDTASYNYRLSGSQFVIIRDSRSCSDTVFFDIPYSGALLDSIVIDPILCWGDTSARIHSFVRSNGTLNIPLAFRLTDAFNNPILGGVNGVDRYSSPLLSAGTYFLQITDTSGCTRLDTILISQAQPLEIIDIDVDTVESCTPGMDASVRVRGFGGTGAYQFNWSNSASGPLLSGVGQGTYTLTLTDENNCSATKTYTVIRPAAIVIDSIQWTGPACAGDPSGSATVHYTEGARPIASIRWNTNETTATINMLREGRYSVTVTDENGCTDSLSVLIAPAGNALRVTSAVLREPRCHGSADGFIILTVTGGQGPYTYNWDNGPQTANNTNLKAGRYCVRIGDFGNCPPFDTCFTLTDPPAIGISISGVQSPTCATPGTCDGRASASMICLDTATTLTWSSGEQTIGRNSTASQLCAGQQFVIATCGFCSDTMVFDVPDAVPLSLDNNFVSVVPPTCYGFSDGAISVRAIGGKGPYQYCWTSPAVNSPNIQGLADGMYYVTVKDSFNCTHLDSIRLRQPDSIRIDIIPGATLDVSCPGRNDGRITTAWTGGNGGAGIFSWTPPNLRDSVLTNLDAGTYTLFVTDSKGCTGEVTHSIGAPPDILATMTPPGSPKCPGDSYLFSVTQATGGSGNGYRFTINNGAPQSLGDQVPLTPGIYAIRIYDSNNCPLDTSITIGSATNFLALDFGRDFDTIQLGDSVLLDGKPVSSAGVATVMWTPATGITDPAATASFASPTRTTAYVLKIVDADGCEISDNITIVVRSTRRFYPPNVFSPNGDNINDEFEVAVGSGVQAIRSFRVFDRWGNLVATTENPAIDGSKVKLWNGRAGHTGDLMNPGVFVYIAEIEFQDGSRIAYRGDITLMR
ncbi:MAG: hypothetical protein JPMHGGIA_02411 [Saprospiraceae bacterium]|nr:hypothetical protein [Saprospiraceae bacterium]